MTTVTSPTSASENCSVSLQAENRRDGLIEIGRTCGVSVILPADLPPGQVNFTRPVQLEEAFKLLLAGTGFSVRSFDDGVVVVGRERPAIVTSKQERRDAVEDFAPRVLLDEVMVTGARLQNLRSITTKRDAVGILDALSQDEIGRQPDFNIADAVQRAPGVLGLRDEEESLFLGLRGLSPDFTYTTFDGATMAPDGNSRRVSLEIIPSSAVARTEVVKTRGASSDGNAIAGTVNLVTRSAFDQQGTYLSLTGLGGYFTADRYDAAENRPSLRFEATYAESFGTDKQVGLVLAGSFFRRDQDEERFLTFYDPTFSVPVSSIWNGVESPYRRFGGFGKVELRPNNELQATLSGYHFEQNENFLRSSLLVFASPSAVINSDQDGGRVIGGDGRIELLNANNDQSKSGASGTIRYDSESVRFSSQIAFSRDERSSAQFPNAQFTYVGPPTGFDYDYEFRGPGTPVQYTLLNPSFAAELENFAFSRLLGTPANRESDVFEGSISASNDLSQSLELSVGGSFRITDFARDFERIDIVFTGDNPPILSDLGRLNGYRAPFAPTNSALIDDTALLDLVGANPDQFLDQSSFQEQIASDFLIHERVYAGYMMLSGKRGRLGGSAGVRLEWTDVGGEAFVSEADAVSDITDTYTYFNALPSLNLRFDAGDDIILRGGYSRALGRANFSDLNPSAAVVEEAAVTLIESGNTQLRPRVADNLDLSFEYYFDGGRSLFSAAVFFKRVHDEIYRLSTTDLSDTASPVVRTRPVNAEKVNVTGFELNIIKDRLDGLPKPLDNFGVSANYTFTDATTTVLALDGTPREIDFLATQPRQLVNAALFYQDGSFEARAAYSFTGRFRNSISAEDSSADDAIANYQTLDLQFRYALSDGLYLRAEGRNVLNETSTELTGPNLSRTEDFSVFGSAYFLGLTYSY